MSQRSFVPLFSIYYSSFFLFTGIEIKMASFVQEILMHTVIVNVWGVMIHLWKCICVVVMISKKKREDSIFFLVDLMFQNSTIFFTHFLMLATFCQNPMIVLAQCVAGAQQRAWIIDICVCDTKNSMSTLGKRSKCACDIKQKCTLWLLPKNRDDQSMYFYF